MIEESIVAIAHGASANEIAEGILDQLVAGAQNKVNKLHPMAQGVLRTAASNYVSSAAPRAMADAQARAASVLSSPSKGKVDDMKKELLKKGLPLLMKKTSEAQAAAKGR